MPSPRAGLLAAIASLAMASCASPCERVRTQHAEVTGRSSSARGDHLRVTLPYEFVDRFVAAEVRRIPQAKLPLPEIAGVSLGTVVLVVDRVVAVPAPAPDIGFRVDVSLRSGGRVLLPIQVMVRVRPRLDAQNGVVVVALDRAGMTGLEAELAPGAMKPFVDAIWARLPDAARMFASRDQIADLAEGLTNELLRDAADVVRRELLDELGEAAHIEIDLPPIPVESIAVRSTARELVVGVHTPLPVRDPVPEQSGRGASPRDQVRLEMSASMAVELANAAMERGEIPNRFAVDGTPDPEGPLVATLDFVRTEQKPLRVHAFLLEPERAGRSARDCVHLVLGATPRIGVADGHLVISTTDAKVEAVEGSSNVKTALFFSGVSRRSFAHAEQLAAAFDFDLGGTPMQARVQSATLSGHALVLGLSLQPARK